MSDSNRSSASQAQRATLYTTFSSATPTGIEPVLPERQSGVLAAILWGYVLCYVLKLCSRLCFGGPAAPANKKAACLIGQAAVSATHAGICLVIPRLPLKHLVPTSTWSGHIKAYTNKPFRILDGRHNCSLKIKHAICIFVGIDLHHCLSFPDLLSFFLRLIYHLRFGLSFNLWYKLVTGTVPVSPCVSSIITYVTNSKNPVRRK